MLKKSSGEKPSVMPPLFLWLASIISLEQPKPKGKTPTKVLPHLIYVFKQLGFIGPVMPVSTVIVATLSGLIPLIVGVSIDSFVVPTEEGGTWSPVLLLSVVAAAFIGPMILETLFRVFIQLPMRTRMVTLLKRHIHQHLQTQSWSFYQERFAGSLGTKVSTLGQASFELVQAYLDQMLYLLTLVIVSLAITAYANWLLLIPLVIWLSLTLVIVLLFYPIAQRKNEKAFEAATAMNGAMVDTYSNAQTVQLFARSDVEDPLVVGLMRRHVALRWDANFWFLLLYNSMNVLNLLLLGVLFGMALWLWSKGMATAGAVAMALPIGMRMVDSVDWLTEITSIIAENTGELKESLATLATEPDMQDEEDAPDLLVREGAIDFQNVGFGYVGGERLFEGLEFSLLPGEKVALVGPSGSGKSTITSLLLRLYDLTSGQILIDGQNIAKVDRNSLRQQIAMVTQDSSLLHRSVADNIRYGKAGASFADVENAARKAGAFDFIQDLSDSEGRKGFEAFVGERGVKLSGGQRQRIALARVLLKDAPIVIFDEATSALDSETEALLQEQLEKVSDGKTVLTIAHRLSTIQLADRIFVIDDGKIVQQGSHEALLKEGGLYADLWARQAGGFVD